MFPAGFAARWLCKMNEALCANVYPSPRCQICGACEGGGVRGVDSMRELSPWTLGYCSLARANICIYVTNDMK